jgi:hypothetical protein
MADVDVGREVYRTVEEYRGIHLCKRLKIIATVQIVKSSRKGLIGSFEDRLLMNHVMRFQIGQIGNEVEG